MQEIIIREKDCLELTKSEKIAQIAYHFRKIMLTLGLDVMDESLKNTPLRVARMYVNEAFMGLDPALAPTVTLFNDDFNYNEIVVERDIPIHSYCEHHFVPIIGKAHIGYISKGQVIGLSKLNRVAHYFSKRPQVQERLTVDIANYLKITMGIEDIAVIINAEHLCVASRGINHSGCATITHSLHGAFRESEKKLELYSLLAI